MNVSVVVPRLPDDGPRDDAWAWCARQWDGFEVIEGKQSGAGPWVKGEAVADGVLRASGDVLVVADADVYVPGVGDAVAAVEAGDGWAVPHRLVHRLDERASAAVLAGGPVGGRLEQRPYTGVAGGGCVVLTRAAYGACPMDPRFVGWGQEDQAWGLALTTLYGRPWRSAEPLWHLWHPPQRRLSRSTGSMAGRMLFRRYGDAARGGQGVMAGLLAEIGAETRESTMYVYENVNNGQRVEFPVRRNRLDRLSNWRLVSEPPPSPPPSEWDGVTSRLPEDLAEEPDPRAVIFPAVTPTVDPVTLPITSAATGDRLGAEHRPAVNEPKSAWLAYAQMLGVTGAERLTKTALIRACG